MATIGFSATLTIGSTEVSESTMIQVPALQASTVESTHLNVTDRIRTYIPGLIDPGTVTFEANYTASIYTALKALIGEEESVTIESPEGENQTFTFDGILTKLDLSFEPDAVSKMKGELKVTGPVTLGTIGS